MEWLRVCELNVKKTAYLESVVKEIGRVSRSLLSWIARSPSNKRGW